MPLRKTTWIESGGGPLLFAAEPLVERWSGTQPSKFLPTRTDYARACEIDDEIAAIPLGTTQALVLADEPDRTALWVFNKDVFFLGWRWAETEESLWSALDAELERLQFAHVAMFSTLAGEHVLFDSAYAGNEIADKLTVSLGTNEYAVESAYLKPKDRVCALIHRLRPVTAI